MRTRVLVIVAAACLVAACSSSSAKKPAAAPPTSSISTAAAAQTSATPSPSVPSTSPSTDVTVGVMCSNLDAQTKDLAALVGKLSAGQSVPALGIGIPIVGAADAARKQRLDHPNSQIDGDLAGFADSLDGLDTAVTASKVDTTVVGVKLSEAQQAWKALAKDCGFVGGYAFSNRLG